MGIEIVGCELGNYYNSDFSWCKKTKKQTEITNRNPD